MTHGEYAIGCPFPQRRPAVYDIGMAPHKKVAVFDVDGTIFRSSLLIQLVEQLIRDGAVVITSSADALALLGLAAPPAERAIPQLPHDEQLIWHSVGFNFTDCDSIGLKTGLTPQACLAAVTSLELRGLVECSLAGEIRRR